MTLICRDDLRYTDDVLAVIHSGLSIAEIATLLNISREDVLYHYLETQGIRRRVAPATTWRDLRPSRWPRDPEWYRQRTAAEIAEAVGVARQTVYLYVRRRGLTYKHARRKPRPPCTLWPTDRAWYAARTAKTIATELGVTVHTVYRYTARHRLPLDGHRNTRLRGVVY